MVLLKPWARIAAQRVLIAEAQCAPSDCVERHDEHADQPLFGVAEPEEHGRDEHAHHEPSASTPDRLLEPRQQVAAIGKLFSERQLGSS